MIESVEVFVSQHGGRHIAWRVYQTSNTAFVSRDLRGFVHFEHLSTLLLRDLDLVGLLSCTVFRKYIFNSQYQQDINYL